MRQVEGGVGEQGGPAGTSPRLCATAAGRLAGASAPRPPPARGPLPSLVGRVGVPPGPRGTLSTDASHSLAGAKTESPSGGPGPGPCCPCPGTVGVSSPGGLLTLQSPQGKGLPGLPVLPLTHIVRRLRIKQREGRLCCPRLGPPPPRSGVLLGWPGCGRGHVARGQSGRFLHPVSLRPHCPHFAASEQSRLHPGPTGSRTRPEPTSMALTLQVRPGLGGAGSWALS